MSKPKVFEKPIGVRDYLPHIVRRLRLIQSQVLDCMERWGYDELMTPTLEYYDTVGVASTTTDSKLFKLLDPKGRTLVLRSDMTAPIARVAASMFKENHLPLRFSYHANVFRAPEEEAGRDAEFFQTGVELIGDASTDADAEVVALAIASLRSAGLNEFKMAIGHSGFISGLMSELLAEQPEEAEILKDFLLKRNHVGYRQRLQSLSIHDDAKQALAMILRLRGGIEVFDQASALTSNVSALEAISELRNVHQILGAYQVQDQVIVDLTMIGDFAYYTGITFEGYVNDQAFPVCNGGRYDLLLQQFGRTAPATGFAIKTNRILEWLEKQQEKEQNALDSYKALVLYDARHRTEAIQYAQRLRSKQGIMVESCFIEATEELPIKMAGEENMMYNGKVYQDIITFVEVKSLS